MDLLKEKEWIKAEIDKVDNPLLIASIKQLLQCGDNSHANTPEEMILEGEADIINGNVIPHEELKAELSSWRK